MAWYICLHTGSPLLLCWSACGQVLIWEAFIQGPTCVLTALCLLEQTTSPQALLCDPSAAAGHTLQPVLRSKLDPSPARLRRIAQQFQGHLAVCLD